MTHPDDAMLTVVVRTDGTYDFRFSGATTRDRVPGLLRQIAEQIERDADIPNPHYTW